MSTVQAIYLHIPFCRKICPFCAFAVRKDRTSLHTRYLQNLIQELQRRAEQLQDPRQSIASIYFGGGTPSSLSLDEVALLLEQVRFLFVCDPDVEITFEVNPEDATLEYLNGLAEMGITRISLGVQSFQDSLLKRLGRNHTAKQAQQAVEALYDSAINNFNLDLMFSIPEQSFVLFQADVEQMLSYQPSHVSLYCLDVEPNTPFSQEPDVVAWVDTHQSLQQQMYLWAIECLNDAGIVQYEVSNFARTNCQSRSNLMVWSGAAYLGLGTGAHSYVLSKRWANHRALTSYQKALVENKWPIAFEEDLSWVQQANERLMLGLRQTAGLSIEEWSISVGKEWPKKNWELMESLCQQGYALWNPPRLQLTPKGLLLADEITAGLFL